MGWKAEEAPTVKEVVGHLQQLTTRQPLTHHSPSPQQDGENGQKGKLIGWDKDSLIRQQKKYY